MSLAKGARVKRLAIAMTAVVAAALPAVAVAKLKPPAAPTTAHISLDSYHAWRRHYTPPVSTPFQVRRGSYDVAIVDGSFSYYAAANYTVPQRPWKIVCGSPQPSAKYPGAGGNGPVGFDAEFAFARPWSSRKCARAHLPQRWRNFQMNAGTGWHHPTLLGPPPSTPGSDHTYSYAVVGDNRTIQFRLKDVLTRDNYGVLKITVRPAAVSDCSSYASFGFASQSACIAVIAASIAQV